MPISVSPSGAQMNDGNTLSRGQTAALLPDQMIDTGSLLIIDGGISFDGDKGILSALDPTFRVTKGDNVYTRVQVINATSSWTVPTGVTEGLVIVIGGGGPGGSGGFTGGGDQPRTYYSGGNGGVGGAGMSYIPLTAGNSMPAVIGAASGTSTFFGISATGGTTGGSASPPTPGSAGTPGTSTTGNFANGSSSTTLSVFENFTASNVFGTIKTVPAQLATAAHLNSYASSSPAGYPAGTIYQLTNIYAAGAGGRGGDGNANPASAGLPGAVIIFY